MSEERLGELPLVSIIIITYNSQKYVLETLDSAKAQTYPNIELIVTDDNSTDNTVEVCKQWMVENKDRFVRTEIITTEKNTGIAPNCNRGLRSSNGVWIKFFAGDDILLPNCIADFIEYIHQTPDCNVLFGRMKMLKNGIISELPSQNNIYALSPNKLYKRLLRGPVIYAPAAFYSGKALDSVGGFDEKYPSIEDRLMQLVLLEKGYKFHYIDTPIAIYRVHESNISGVQLNNKGKKRVSRIYYDCWKRMLLNEILPRQIKEMLFVYALHVLYSVFINGPIVPIKSNISS